MGTTTITAGTEDGGFKATCEVSITTGILENETSINITLYPNETHDKATLIADGIDGECNIEITDLSGTILHTFTAMSSDNRLETTIGLSNYTAVMYFVKLQNKKQIAIKQIIKN